jgi:hypothetical protein
MSDYFPCMALPWPPEHPVLPAWPAVIRAKIGGPRPGAIKTEWALGEDGRPELGHWTIDGSGPATTTALRRDIPRVLELLRTSAELATEPLDGVTDEQGPALLRQAARRARRKSAGPGRPPLTDDYLRDVARTWAAAKAAHKHPVLAVATRYAINRNTAAGHGGRARKRGYTGEHGSA